MAKTATKRAPKAAAASSATLRALTEQIQHEEADLRQGGEIHADGEVIHKDGKWVGI